MSNEIVAASSPEEEPDDEQETRRGPDNQQSAGSAKSRRGETIPSVNDCLRAIAQLDEVPVGGSKTFHYPEETDPCLLLRPSERSFLAYDQKCTHLSCAVIPEMSQGQLRCPCHHGYFEMASGRPLAGPPRRPLPRITLEIRDGIVYATGIERSMV